MSKGHRGNADTDDNAEVVIRKDASTAALTLTAPQRRNVLSAEMVTEFGAAYDELEADPATRCVAITGVGSFCAGAQLSTLEAPPRPAISRGCARCKTAFCACCARRSCRSRRSMARPSAPVSIWRWPATCVWPVTVLGSTPGSPRCGCIPVVPTAGCSRRRSAHSKRCSAACPVRYGMPPMRFVSLVTAIHPTARLVAEAVELAGLRGAQDAAYTRRLTATLRRPARVIRRPARPRDRRAAKVAAATFVHRQSRPSARASIRVRSATGIRGHGRGRRQPVRRVFADTRGCSAR